MIRTYGRDALVKLIRSYADGRTDDEAFRAALGLDMTAFGDAWFKDVNATPKTKSGPQPAPPGPVPSAWTGAVAGGAGVGRAGARRTRRRRDGRSGAVGCPRQLRRLGRRCGGTTIGLLVAIGVIVVLVGVALAARRRRASEAAP